MTQCPCSCRHRELSSRGVSRQQGNPTIIKGRDTRAMWSLLGTPPAQQHCLHQASCLAQWYQDVPKCSSLTTSVLVWSPNSATAPHSSAAKPQPLSHSWHSIPGDKGHRTGRCRHHGAGLALETGLESIHLTEKVVMDGCWGYGRGKQAGAQLGEISNFKRMIQREAIHGAHAPMATGEST